MSTVLFIREKGKAAMVGDGRCHAGGYLTHDTLKKVYECGNFIVGLVGAVGNTQRFIGKMYEFVSGAAYLGFNKFNNFWLSLAMETDNVRDAYECEFMIYDTATDKLFTGGGGGFEMIYLPHNTQNKADIMAIGSGYQYVTAYADDDNSDCSPEIKAVRALAKTTKHDIHTGGIASGYLLEEIGNKDFLKPITPVKL